MGETKKKCIGNWEIFRYLKCRTQGCRESVRAPEKYSFLAPCQGWAFKGKKRETKQRAAYARWPPAARAFNMAHHYLLTFHTTTERDKNIRNIVEHRAPFRTAGPPGV